MGDKTRDLGSCRTGYTSDVTDDGSDDTFNHLIEWGSDNTDPLFVETIEQSFVVSNSDIDSGTSLIDNGDFTYNYSGMYTIDSFPNVSMKFRDFETSQDIGITGWPPSDDRAKDMFEFNLDPRDANTYEIVITWKISAILVSEIPLVEDEQQVNPPYFYDESLDQYVRTNTFTFYKDAVNRTGEQFGKILGEYFSSIIDDPDDTPDDIPGDEPVQPCCTC